MAATIIYGERDAYVATGSVREDGDHLWLSAQDAGTSTGWTLKPEGLCRGEACVPLPGDGSWTDSEGRIDIAAFARREGRPLVRDEQHGIWAFGPRAQQEQTDELAPDFTLPDIDGELHSLADYRGRKVFLYTWGSYCGCSFDPPVWEVVYGELKDANFEMISVALDTAGRAAVEDRIRPQALDERPDAIRRLRGWSEERWNAKAAPSHPCLIDEDHSLAASYGMSNVPMAVWIDEEGRIVRPAEPAGVSDHFRRMDPDSFAIPDDDAEKLVANRERYIDALRDWVEAGEQSEFALTPEQVRARTHAPTDAELRAALHIQIGRRLYQSGEVEAAKRHVEAATELCPEKWNYRRQAMVLDREAVGTLNVSPGYWEAIDALGSDEFYPEIELPGMSGPPEWLTEPS